jgi:2'-5' RNA ligase
VQPCDAALRRSVMSSLAELLARARGYLRPTVSRSALVVPMPDLGPALSAVRRGHDPSARGGMPAHVTLLFPFLPVEDLSTAVEATLARVVGSHPAFPFRLATVGRFPAVLYLAPDPAEPFIDLVRALVAEWPLRPPYGGRFRDVVPHVTVAQGRVSDRLVRLVERELPVLGRASHVDLMVEDRARRWHLRKSFDLA